jgi:hypothetical protein
MFKVTLVNLSPDDLSASPSFGANSVGDVDLNQFTALLEWFQTLDSIQILEADPHIIAESRNGKYLIRTGHGKLFLYDARDSAQPYAELTAGEIARQLSAGPDSAPEDEALAASAPNRTPHRGIAVAMLIAGLGLNGYTLYSVFYIDDVNQKPAITVITDQTELAARQSAIVGRYATGNEPGDRFIAVGADGRVRFGEIVTTGHRPESSDSYRIGRYDEKLCLTTPESGVIDITGINTLVYYRDIYRRTK